MKLTEEDKNMLIQWGYSEEDIPQIKKAIRVSQYYVYEIHQRDIPISLNEALELLGRGKFLSGIARSAFHWSALRENNNVKILFSSKKLFF